jgi:hypothetical protein
MSLPSEYIPVGGRHVSLSWLKVQLDNLNVWEH